MFGNRKKDKHSSRSFRSVAEKDAPFGYVEAFKSLRTNINFMSVSKKLQTIVITSSIPGEGKSNMAINLATSLAETKDDVLLVDCDLRKPAIYKYLGIAEGRNIGLSTVLTGKSTLDESIHHMSGLHIHVLCAGAVPPNPAEMLGSSRMEQLIEELKKHFTYIIFDTPPVSVVTDAAVLSRYTDGTILVVRHKFANSEVAKLAKANLDAVNTNIIGAVMSVYDAKASSRDNGYYYSYGYGYGYGYGENEENKGKKK